MVTAPGPLSPRAAGRFRNLDRKAISVSVAVVARLAEDYEALHIETQKVFDAAADAFSPEQWIWDGVPLSPRATS